MWYRRRRRGPHPPSPAKDCAPCRDRNDTTPKEVPAAVSDRIPNECAISEKSIGAQSVVESKSPIDAAPVTGPSVDAALSAKKRKNIATPSEVRKKENAARSRFNSEPCATRGPYPMAELQRTIGAPSTNETNLFARRLMDQQVGGLRPPTYNWLVFGRGPKTAIASSAPTLPAAIGSVTDDASEHTAYRDQWPANRRNSRSRNRKKCLRRTETG